MQPIILSQPVINHPEAAQPITSSLSVIPTNISGKIGSVETSNVDISTLNAIDLTHFRNSNLPTYFYFFLAVPIIGWVAFACLKINYVIKNTRAERIIKEGNYNSASMADKIKILNEVIAKSGPLAWQYRLELTRLQLLNGDKTGANATLNEINTERGSPDLPNFHYTRGLVSIETAPSPYGYGINVIKLTHHTTEEAILNASAHTLNGRLDAAYDSYNQAIYYNRSLWEKIRPVQVALVKKMQECTIDLPTRALEIIEAEIKFTARQKQAKAGEVGGL